MPQILAKFVFQHQLSVKALCLKLWPLHYKTNEKEMFGVLLLPCVNSFKSLEWFVHQQYQCKRRITPILHKCTHFWKWKHTFAFTEKSLENMDVMPSGKCSFGLSFMFSLVRFYVNLVPHSSKILFTGVPSCVVIWILFAGML